MTAQRLTRARPRLLVGLLSGALVVGGGAAFASAPHQTATKATVLAGSVLGDLSQFHRVGATDPHKPIVVDIAIARPDPAGEQAAYTAIYSKNSPDYHHFLSTAEFDARFGVPTAHFDVVRRFATAHGLDVAFAPDSRDLLALSGTVAQVEKTFKVRLSDYAWPANYRFRKQDGPTFFANDDDPTVPAGMGIFGVIGLNSAQRSHTPEQTTCAAGRCVGLTTPQDLWSIYGQPTDYKSSSADFGQGQKMAIFGEGQTDPVIKNLRVFEGLHGLRRIPVNVVHADGPKADYSDDSGEEEWEIDTQSSTGMSPKAFGETLYFGHDLSDASVLNVFNNWADDPNGPLQASASYGECEESLPGDLLAKGKVPTYPKTGPAGYAGSAGAAYTTASEAALLKANMEGRSLFSSTGDTGSSCPILVATGLGAGNGVANQFVPVPNYPASSPHVVAVGGTVLYGNGATQPKRSLEYAWTFTGGGTSFRFGKPAYQNSETVIAGRCITPGPSGSACRGVPDVAAQSGDVASNGYGIVAGGETNFPGGGTSLSSPLWLGMWTRIQAAAPAAGLGFADETFYKMPSSDFFDIGGVSTQTTQAGNGLYFAIPKWDYVSGLGTPNVTSLLNSADHRTTPTHNVLPPEAPVATGGVTSLIQPCKPLFTDAAGDDTFGIDVTGTSTGKNPQLDIVQGDMHSKLVHGTPTLETVMTLRDLSTKMAYPAGAANEYYFLWSYKKGNGAAIQYFTNAEVATPGGTTYHVGSVQGSVYQNDTSATGVTGSFHPGKDGTIVVDVPLKDVGSVAPGSVLTAPGAQTKVLVGSTATGGSIQAVDDAGPDFNFAIGEVCEATGRPGSGGGVLPVSHRVSNGSTSPSLATTGLNAALPIAALVFLGLFGMIAWLRRRPGE